jgi:hypothetical protein
MIPARFKLEIIFFGKMSLVETELWVYPNDSVLIYLTSIIFSVFMAIYGGITLLLMRFKKGTLYVFPAVLFLMLLHPSFYPLRMKILNIRHYVQFIFEKDFYEGEVKK